MNNINSDNNQDSIYVDNPDEGRSREQVSGDNSQSDTNTRRERPDQMMTGTTRDQALQAGAQQGNGPISSGQQSSTSSDSSGVGGYGTPESGFGSDAQGGNAQPMGGYNQSGYNQQGTYSESQGNASENDGLRDTLGSSYDPQQQQNNPGMAQQGYDPTHSGARRAQNNPGETVDTPGRDVGSSWGQDEQMGSSTDTSDRGNPGA